MVGGTTAFGAGHYDETVIDKLMPVDCYGNHDFNYRRFKLKVPEEMLDHPVMALGTAREETARIWRERPFSAQALKRALRAWIAACLRPIWSARPLPGWNLPTWSGRDQL